LNPNGQSPLAGDAGSLPLLPSITLTPAEGPAVYFNRQGLWKAGMQHTPNYALK